MEFPEALELAASIAAVISVSNKVESADAAAAPSHFMRTGKMLDLHWTRTTSVERCTRASERRLAKASSLRPPVCVCLVESC